MSTTLRKENKGKPTPPFWKGFGRALVLLATPITAIILVVPIPEPWKTIIAVSANALLALGKELTTYTFNPKQVPLSYFPQKDDVPPTATKDVTEEVARIEEKLIDEKLSK